MENQISFEDIKELFRLSRIENDRRSAEVDRKIAELGKQIGGLGNRLGEFVEGVVRPGLVRLFRERGLPVHQTLRDLEARRDGVAGQVDLLVVNDVYAVAVEVKSKLSCEDVDEHVERMGKFKVLFPQYRDTRLLGAVAAMVIPDDAAEYAEKKGLFVIGQKGEDAALLNAEGFEPRAW